MLLLSSNFRMTIACEADRWTLFVSGDVDLARDADLASVAQVLADRRVSHVAIDLGHVTFIDCAGYRAVERAAAVLRAAGTRVRVVNPSRAVARLIAALETAGEQVAPGSEPAPADSRVPRRCAGRGGRPVLPALSGTGAAGPAPFVSSAPSRRPAGPRRGRPAVLATPQPEHPPRQARRSVP